MLPRLIVMTIVASAFSYLGLLVLLYVLRQRIQVRFLYEITEQILALPAVGLGLFLSLLLSTLIH